MRITEKPRLEISGKVQVFCLHGVEKRRGNTVEFDPLEERAHICLCCNNVYSTSSRLPGKCPQCGGPE